jgi:hypothetical protein
MTFVNSSSTTIAEGDLHHFPGLYPIAEFVVAL